MYIIHSVYYATEIYTPLCPWCWWHPTRPPWRSERRRNSSPHNEPPSGIQKNVWMAFNVFAFNVLALITRTTHSSTRVPPQASCLDESRIATIQGNSPWGTISKLISMITIPHGHIININILGHYQNTFNRSQYLIPIPPRPGCPRFPSTQSWCFLSWRRNMIYH